MSTMFCEKPNSTAANQKPPETEMLIWRVFISGLLTNKVRLRMLPVAHKPSISFV